LVALAQLLSPKGAASLRQRVPLLPSRVLREAVAKGFEVLSRAGLTGTSLRDLEPDDRHRQFAATLALDELGRRELRALNELAAHPPAWLVAAVGRPNPADRTAAGGARGSWAAVIAQAMAYRLQYDIGDPTRALGASPTPTSPFGLARETDWCYVLGEIRWSAGNLGEHLHDPAVLGVFDATGRVDPQQALPLLRNEVAGRARLSETRKRRARAAPSHVLRTRVADALDLLRQQPADRSAELEQLRTARDNIAVLYRQEVATADRGLRQGTSEMMQCQPHQECLPGRLQELDATIAQVERAQDDRATWDARHAQVLVTGRLAAEELAQREHQVLLALEQDPPDYLVAELGRPPGDRAGRATWQRGMRIIERLRTCHEIDDPARPFGRHRDATQQAHLARIRYELDLVKDGLRRHGPAPPALPAPSHHGLLPGR
jgi:hypothetical protein